MDKAAINAELRKGKEILAYPNEVIEGAIKNPLANAIYKHTIQDQKKNKPKYDPKERVTCRLCNKVYLRSTRSRHNNTKIHQAYAQMNDKVMQLLMPPKKS